MSAETLQQISLKEVEEHDTSESMWIVIDNKIYDLTDFAAEHPGGANVLEENAGRDATQEFEDAGHSDDARAMMKDFLIGELAEVDREKVKTKMPKLEPQQGGFKWPELNSWAYWLIPIGVVVGLLAVRHIWKGSSN